jgi:hypothetical protein
MPVPNDCDEHILPSLLALLSEPQPDENSIPEPKRGDYRKRRNALRSIWGGATVHAAAAFHGVNRNTLRRVAELAERMHPDGRPWALRACIPGIRKGRIAASQMSAPLAAAPHAMEKLLDALPDIRSFVDKYTGPLPTRQQSSPKFDRFFERFLSLLKQANLEHAYLDCGRFHRHRV